MVLRLQQQQQRRVLQRSIGAAGLSSLTSALTNCSLCAQVSSPHIPTHRSTTVDVGAKIYILSHLLETTLAATCSAVYCRWPRRRAILDFLHWFHRPAIIIVKYIVLLAVEGL